jgi:hypothetical protein
MKIFSPVWCLVWWLDLFTTFNTCLVTTCNYNTMTDLHTLQITVTATHAKPSQSAFSSRFPVMDLNNGDSSASVLMSLTVRRISHHSLSSKHCPTYNPSACTNRKHSCFLLRPWLLGFPHDRYSASLLARWLLPSNGCCLALCSTIFA